MVGNAGMAEESDSFEIPDSERFRTYPLRRGLRAAWMGRDRHLSSPLDALWGEKPCVIFFKSPSTSSPVHRVVKGLVGTVHQDFPDCKAR